MKTILRSGILMLIAIFAVGIATNISAQNAQLYGGAGFTAFEDINFAGRAQTFRDDVPDMTQNGWNDMMSSFRIGRGERWELCEDIYYGGRCVIVTGSEADMRANDWNDTVSSIRRVTGNRPPTQNPSGDYLVMYNQPNYRGNTTTYSRSDANINDNARSVTVGRGVWEICDGRNFTGRCVTISQNVSNLASLRIGRIIRSVRPAGIVPPVGGGNYPGREGFVVLYDQTNFRGAQTNSNEVRPNIEDAARSVTVNRGTWQLCEGVNFTGTCVTVTQNINDLRTVGIRRTVRSLRPLGIVPPTFPGQGNRNWLLVLFARQDFQGTSMPITGAEPNMNAPTRSATVSGGVWEVCDGPNYTGRCQTLTVNVPNFNIYSIGNRIRSARPQR
jgi:hypothetical protein